MQIKYQAAIMKKTTAFETKNKNGNFPEVVTSQTLDKEIKECRKKIKNYEELLANGNSYTLFAGAAFVSFQTEKMKNDLLKNYKYSKLQRFIIAFKTYWYSNLEKNVALLFHDQRLIIEQAAEPGDVYWNNIGLPDKQKYIRKFFGHIFSFSLILGCGVFIYYFTIEESVIDNTFVQYLLAFGVVLLNKVLSTITPKIVAY